MHGARLTDEVLFPPVNAGADTALAGRSRRDRKASYAAAGALITALVPVLVFTGALPYASSPPNLAGATIYGGVVPLLAVLLCLRVRGRRAQVVLCGIIVLASLGLAFGVPSLNPVNHLPAIRWTAVGRFRQLPAFAVTLAAAHAFGGLRARGRVPRRIAARWAAVPPGGPVIRLRYEPASFRIGLLIRAGWRAACR